MIHSSAFWVNHYKNNLLNKPINWDIKPLISDLEKNKSYIH